MARPTKQGLDYFSFDVDFYDNLKIRKIMRACGPGAGSILTCLLCNIYRNKGYYILWDEDLPFDIADKVGVSEGAVSEVITKAVQVDFFDQYQYERNKILTSEEIQKRYKMGTLKRQEVILMEEFTIFSGDNRVNDGRNSINGADNAQSKVKEIKANKSKVHSIVGSGEPTTPTIHAIKSKYDQLTKTFEGKDRKVIWVCLKEFITQEKPEIIEPYVDAWNIFADAFKIPKVEVISDSRRKKFKTRISEGTFDFLKILEGIKSSAHLKGDNQRGWSVGFDWIVENDKNYLKILEGNYN